MVTTLQMITWKPEHTNKIKDEYSWIVHSCLDTRNGIGYTASGYAITISEVAKPAWPLKTIVWIYRPGGR